MSSSPRTCVSQPNRTLLWIVLSDSQLSFVWLPLFPSLILSSQGLPIPLP
jgi:hypothetical protein